MADDVECPYCNHGFDIDGPFDDDGWEQDCPRCGKTIMITAEVCVDYTAEEIPETTEQEAQ